MKKVLALALALALMLGVCSAMAATITVDNVKNGETYHAYKLLNYTNSGSAYSYYLTADEYTSFGAVLEGVGFTFTASADGTRYLAETSKSAEEITAALETADLTKALQHTTKQATADGALTFDDELATGYWYVTSSLGALTSLQSYDAQALVVEKNTIPTIDKKESKTESDYTDGPIDENIGDTIYYQIVVTDGVGTNAQLTVTDTMTAGLTYNAGTLKINGTAVADDADVANEYKVTVSGQKITIVFAPAYVAALDTNETITITFNATINENAVINSATGNENKVELDYSSQHSEDKVYVETYDFLVKKTDGTNFLDGAEFKLYDAETGGNQIILSQDATGYYKDAANGSADLTIDINFADGCNVRGLEPGTYYLEEVVVPDGYNQLAARQAVTVTTGQTATVEVIVVNNAGTELPSTGGIGTTIFYVTGLIMVLGASVILVARRRADAK